MLENEGFVKEEVSIQVQNAGEGATYWTSVLEVLFRKVEICRNEKNMRARKAEKRRCSIQQIRSTTAAMNLEIIRKCCKSLQTTYFATKARLTYRDQVLDLYRNLLRKR